MARFSQEMCHLFSLFFSSLVSVERWCRLRGNLLFYFKSRDHWSEPAGVIVVEDCEVDVEDNASESTFGIILTFSGGKFVQGIGIVSSAEKFYFRNGRVFDETAKKKVVQICSISISLKFGSTRTHIVGST